jgi:hypothetical protein
MFFVGIKIEDQENLDHIWSTRFEALKSIQQAEALSSSEIKKSALHLVDWSSSSSSKRRFRCNLSSSPTSRFHLACSARKNSFHKDYGLFG